MPNSTILMVFVAAIGACALFAFSNWRLGLLLAVVIGLLQDPVRKMVPGRPPWLVLSFLPVYVSVFVTVLGKGYPIRNLLNKYLRLKTAIVLLALALFSGTVITIANYGIQTVPLVVLGLMAYGGGIPSIAIGYFAIRDTRHLRNFLSFVVVLSSVMLSGMLLEYHGYPWDVLGTLSGDKWVHHFGWGKHVNMLSGFFRSPEILGWQASLVTMLAITLALISRHPIVTALWLMFAGWGGIGCLLSGRRKSLVMVLAFVASLTVLAIREKRPRIGLASFAIVVVAALLAQIIIGEADINDQYVELFATAPEAAHERLGDGTYHSLAETIRQGGVLGYGLGTASQGAQHLNVKRPKMWQEGGLAKILAELGVLGLVALVFFGASLGLACHSVLISARNSFKEYQTLAICLFSILVTNGICFVTAAQIFGDPFTLFLIGTLTGFLLSIDRLVRAAKSNMIPRRALPFEIQPQRHKLATINRC